MSLNKFTKLFNELDSNNSKNKKIKILENYFSSGTPLNNAWTIYLLIGKKNKRFISGKLLRSIYSKIYKMPIWLIDTCYSKVGDSAEVIALLLKDKNKETELVNNINDISLNELLKNKLPFLSTLEEEDKVNYIQEIWENLPNNNFLVFNKILTGTFRIGVSKGTIIKCLANMNSIDETIISHRLMGSFEPKAETYNFIINKKLDRNELSYKPFPFQLANPFENKIKDSQIDNYQFEWKWDGIRSQLVKRNGKVSIWSRGEELINNSFPELILIISSINEDFVLDGEILVWDLLKNFPNDFSFLQKRLGRKSPSTKTQKEFPIAFVAYDLLELNGIDLRENILSKRRKYLENFFYNLLNNNETNFGYKFQISKLLKSKNWDEVENIRKSSRKYNTEGLVIKLKNSKYLSGRKKGNWWKYKLDPLQLDAILIYAKIGSGKRADLYTDYSFALWKEKKLVKFASAYSGLTNIEIKELDKWIRKNTLERYGPVRSVKPELVFEISFDNIQISKRHKSGIALRFPRITKWRKDKNIMDADNLENAMRLLRN